MNALLLLLATAFAFADETSVSKFDLSVSGIYVGPTIGGQTTGRSHTPGFGLNFGYNLTERSMLGLNANYFRNHTDEVGISNTFTELNFSLLYRYWLASQGETWRPYLEGGAGMSHDHQTYGSNEWSRWKPVFSGGLGVRYSLTKNVALDLGIHSDIKLTDPGWVYGQAGISYAF